MILKTFRGRLWLSSTLTISRKLRIQRKMTFQNPRIWLLTGLIALTDASAVSISQRDSSYNGTVSVPLPDPSGVTALLQIIPQLKGQIASNWQVSSGMRRLGSKVYAAQWQRLNVRYSSLDDGDVLPNQVNLLNIFSARASRGDLRVAEVSVENVKAAPVLADEEPADEAYEAEFNEDYWQRFWEELEDVNADLEE